LLERLKGANATYPARYPRKDLSTDVDSTNGPTVLAGNSAKAWAKRQQLNSIGERTIVVQLLAVGCCKLLHTIKKVNGQHLIVTIDQYHLKRVHFSSSLKDCYCFSGLDGELV
jgi:hypothetical protein